jgi:hypothetical protein
MNYGMISIRYVYYAFTDTNATAEQRTLAGHQRIKKVVYCDLN